MDSTAPHLWQWKHQVATGVAVLAHHHLLTINCKVSFQRCGGKSCTKGSLQFLRRVRNYSLFGFKTMYIVLRSVPLGFPIKCLAHSQNRNPQSPRARVFCTIVYTNSTKVKPRQGRSRKTTPYNNGTYECITLQLGNSRVINLKRELNAHFRGERKGKKKGYVG